MRTTTGDRSAPAAALGLTAREVARWSLARVLAAIDADPLNLPGAEFEGECSAEIARRLGRQATPGYVLVPLEVLHRDLTAGVAGAGGYLVGTSTASFAAALRGASIAATLGIETIGPMLGNVSAPVLTTPPAATWLAGEGTPTTESQHVFGATALAPKSVASFFEFARALVKVAPPAVFDALVLGELARGLAAGVDAALIAGTGASGQPTGIVNTTGVFAQSGTSLSFAGVCSMIEAVEAAGLPNRERAGFVLGTTAARLLRQRERATGSGNIYVDGLIDGFRALSTRNAPATTVVFGDWSRAAIVEWGQLEIGSDPFTGFKEAKIAARAIWSVDVWVRQPSAFAKAESIT